MAIYVKGDAVANATSYELFEEKDGAYTSLATAEEINFEVSGLGLEAGNHNLVVQAHGDGYESSEYSEAVVYTVPDTVPGIDGVENEIFNLWNTDITPAATLCTYTKETDRIIIITDASGITKWYNASVKYTIPVVNGTTYNIQGLVSQTVLDAETAGTVKLGRYIVTGASGNLVGTTALGGTNANAVKQFTADQDTIALVIYPLTSTDEELHSISSVIQNFVIVPTTE